jgi:hypothetical protein
VTVQVLPWGSDCAPADAAVMNNASAARTGRRALMPSASLNKQVLLCGQNYGIGRRLVQDGCLDDEFCVFDQPGCSGLRHTDDTAGGKP